MRITKVGRYHHRSPSCIPFSDVSIGSVSSLEREADDVRPRRLRFSENARSRRAESGSSAVATVSPRPEGGPFEGGPAAAGDAAGAAGAAGATAGAASGIRALTTTPGRGLLPIKGAAPPSISVALPHAVTAGFLPLPKILSPSSDVLLLVFPTPFFARPEGRSVITGTAAGPSGCC